MGLIWRTAKPAFEGEPSVEAGHDIRAAGNLAHQLTHGTFENAQGTLKQKENIIEAGINSDLNAAQSGLKAYVHIFTMSPLRYSLRVGPKEIKPEDNWWEDEN